MAGAETDLFARVVSGMALAISAATFIWSRLDKHWERQAAAKADLPTVRARWNPQIDDDGYYTIKFGFRDVSRAISFNEARVIKPRRAVIATWDGKQRGKDQSRNIPLKWTFDVSINPAMGSDAYAAHLHLKPHGDLGANVEIELSGSFSDGARSPVKMRVAARIE
ncbi:hypothetical protein [Bradyrhizobium sp. URHC0002]